VQPIIETRRAELAALCRRFHVRRLDVFGSAAGNDFDSTRSDVDFLVEFEPLPHAAYADTWFGLQEGLEALFGRPVDLVSARAVVNPYFAASIAATRESVYPA
jgi:predicted nucleotidyltransferase